MKNGILMNKKRGLDLKTRRSVSYWTEEKTSVYQTFFLPAYDYKTITSTSNHLQQRFREDAMKAFQFFFSNCFIVVLMAGFALNCEKSGPPIEQRLQALEDKGAPDSILSNAKIYLSNVQYLSKTGGAGKYKDSLKTSIAAAEAWFEKAMTESKAYIESARKTIIERKAQLKGMALKDCDNLLQTADSLVKINWLIAARTQVEKIEAAMPLLLGNQKKADALKPTIIGTWKAAHVVLPTEDDEKAKYKALETQIYTFGKDGSFSGIEEKHGQSTHYMKEDWKFLSWGTYDLSGDSIYLFISREKCAQQVYTNLNMKTNKWEKKAEPLYDSTITTHKKDKFIVYNDLKSDFKKIK